MDHSELKLKLYIDLIQSLALDNPILLDLVAELTMGLLITDIPCSEAPILTSTENNDIGTSSDPPPNRPFICGVLQENDLLTFGTSSRYHLSLSTRRRMVQEIQSTLHSIAEFFYGESSNADADILTGLPEKIQAYRTEMEDKKQEVSSSFQRVAELQDQIRQAREDFDHELHQAVSVIFPAHDATRTSSIDLLAATIETALVKISLTRARAERGLYNHQPQNTDAFDQDVNVAKAIENAYLSLKKDEKEMKMQSQSMDSQLQEYESLMQLVDGGGNGYQQIINDWTKVQQGTDECLKDLRRLGWTGD